MVRIMVESPTNIVDEVEHHIVENEDNLEEDTKFFDAISNPQEEEGDMEVENSQEVKVALEKLVEVRNTISNVEQKMKISMDNLGNEYNKIIGNYWYKITFNKDASFYKPLHASIQKRKALGYVEELMVILLKLDEVDSYGNEEIREQRRELVRKINNTLMKEADGISKLYGKLFDFNQKYKSLSDQYIEEKTNQTEEEEESEMEVEQDEEEEEEVPQQNEEEPKLERPNLKTDEEGNPKPKRELRYRVKEFPNKLCINVLAPNSMVQPRNVEIYLDSESDLVVNIGQFESLKFELANRLNKQQITYKQTGPSSIQITIPKYAVHCQPRRRQVVDPFGSMPRYHTQHNPFGGFYNQRRNYPTTIWG